MKIKNSRLLDWKFLVSFVFVVVFLVAILALMQPGSLKYLGLALVYLGLVYAFITALFVIIAKWFEIDFHGWYLD